MRSLKVLFALVVLCSPVFAQGQTVNDDAEFVLNAVGDVTMTNRTEFSAPGWRLYKALQGEGPDVIKRDLVRRFPKLSVEDVRVSFDEANRVLLQHCVLRSWADYDGDGRFAVRVASIWKPVSNNGTEWAFSAQVASQVNPQTIKVILPPGARDARLSEANDGKRFIYYTLSTGAGLGPAWILAGVGLIGLVASGGLAVSIGRSSRKPSKQTPRAKPAKKP